MGEDNSNYTIKSVERAFKVLESLKEERELGVAELSRKVDLPKSTIYYILATLSKLNYIKKNNNNKYSLGLKSLELGTVMLNKMTLRSIAKPYLMELVEESSETVHLVILDNYQVVYIDKIEGNEAIQISSHIGARLPSYCTGVGKAMLAYLDEKKLDEYLKNNKLKKHTKNTITDPSELKEELKEIKNKGYSIDNQEFNKGLKCFAAPIMDYSGEVIAAISISGPIDRITDKNENDNLINMIIRTAEKISHNMGYVN